MEVVQLHMQLSLVGLRFQQGPVNMKEPGEEWEDEPVCNTPEQNDSNTYVDEARNDGQESEQNTSGTGILI